MSRKKKGKTHEVENMQPQLKKKFTLHDITTVKPLTRNQAAFFSAWDNNPKKHFALFGSAGTGKSYLSLYKGFVDLLSKEHDYEKIVIIRSAVPSRDLGFTPGSLEEKVALYETPYVEICNELFRYSKSYENLKELGLVEFHATSYLRGQTFKDSIVILDEAQNCTREEWNTVFTRIGTGSKLVICGDIAQNDLVKKKNESSGFDDFYEIIVNMEKHFDMIEFGHDDIVRSGFVRDFIITKERLSK